ncbi:MAG: RNA polymerase sigma factor [Chloroflexota bacterium]|nr:RNA polymerase sigma factor [Chloroflexota bacterium]
MEKRELVERAQRGDHDAFAALTRATVARADAAARLILRDAQSAEDAVQDAYVRAWRDLRGLRDPDRFDAWLHRLLVNACRDQLRRRRRRVIEVEMSELVEPEAPDPFARGLARDEMERAFRRLSADQRAVIVLHYYLDLPLPEAAPLLGIPLGTAKSRLHRAVQAMKSALERDASPADRPAEGPVP